VNAADCMHTWTAELYSNGEFTPRPDATRRGGGGQVVSCELAVKYRQ